MPKSKQFAIPKTSSKVFLTSTDTTIGFISQDAHSLNRIKQRPPQKHYIIAVESLQALRQKVRIPSIHRKRVRKSKKTTFIYPNGISYRVIFDRRHRRLIQKLGGWAYTTSANLSGKNYNETWAISKADVTIYPLTQGHPSTIVKLGKQTLKKIR